jgi:hypothetical protein
VRSEVRKGAKNEVRTEKNEFRKMRGEVAHKTQRK